MSVTDIIQILLSILSLVATVAVSVVIYYCESKKDHRKEQRELTNRAHSFIIDNKLGNENFKDYIPLASVIAIKDSLYKPFKDIYLNFFKCEPELQNIILEHLHIPLRISSNNSIFEKCKKKWCHYEVENKIGKLGFKWRLEKINFFDIVKKYINSDIKTCQEKCFQIPVISDTLEDFSCNKPSIKNVDLLEYIDRYLDCVHHTNTWKDIKNYPNLHLEISKSPFIVLNEKRKKENWSEQQECMWYMWYIICTCESLVYHDFVVEQYNRKYYLHVKLSNINTFEDLYAYMLLTLLNTFGSDEDIFPQKKSFLHRLTS